MGILSGLFSSGVVDTVENIASELIETKKETAEANTLMLKTLDPNGLMRRRISEFTCRAYGFYLLSTLILIIMHFFGIGDSENAKGAMGAMTELFMPITTAWGAIVGASFGVNGVNSYKEKQNTLQK